MKLDRNINPDGRGKYALINLRKTAVPLEVIAMAVTPGLHTPLPVELGDTPESEFFIIKLKDKYAAPALIAYAQAAREDDEEYANEILALADRANNHPLRKMPD
jgi:hypothetical protein